MANFENGTDMVYDLESHRYVLTEDYFNNYHNVNLTDILINKTDVDPDAVSRVFLKRVSNVFYNYILSTVPDVEKGEYWFSLPRYRRAIREGMLELGYSFIINNRDNTIILDDSGKTGKAVPMGVETICLNYGLFNRAFMRVNPKYKDSMGVDW